MSDRKTITAPKWHGQEAVQYSASVPTAFSVAIGVNDANEPQFTTVDAPIGSHNLFCQRRVCGDHYAEFTAGKLIQSAIGKHQLDAIRAAAAKFEVAA